MHVYFVPVKSARFLPRQLTKSQNNKKQKERWYVVHWMKKKSGEGQF